MDIVMVSPYADPIRGGISSYVRGLSSALRRQGATVTVLAREGAPESDVEILGGTGGAFAASAARRIESLGPDVIHAHAHWYAIRAALRAAHRTRSAVVFTVHTNWPDLGSIRRVLLRRMLLESHRITFPSRFLRAQIPFSLPDSLCEIIPPGAGPALPDAETVERLKRQAQEVGWSAIIGYVGKFEWPSKVEGFRLLLTAISLPPLRDVGVLAAGGGSRLKEAEAAARALSVQDRVRFLADVSNPWPIYAACDTYCHPSLQEGMSISVLEAMLAGAPIVGFRLPFMEEAISAGREGLLTEPTPEALAEALAALLSNPAHARSLGAAAMARARLEFDWTRIAARFLDIYRGRRERGAG